MARAPPAPSDPRPPGLALGHRPRRSPRASRGPRGGPQERATSVFSGRLGCPGAVLLSLLLARVPPAVFGMLRAAFTAAKPVPGHAAGVPRYVRPRVPGATVFFTVCLARRGSDLLVREIDALREAVRTTRAERPFAIDAWVVLLDHMHFVWTLPEGDAAYAVRWGAIKSRFTRAVRGRVGFNPTLRSPSKVAKGDCGRLAAPLLGAPHPRRRGPRRASALLLGEPREARPGRAARGLAPLLDPPRHPPRPRPARMVRCPVRRRPRGVGWENVGWASSPPSPRTSRRGGLEAHPTLATLARPLRAYEPGWSGAPVNDEGPNRWIG